MWLIFEFCVIFENTYEINCVVCLDAVLDVILDIFVDIIIL